MKLIKDTLIPGFFPFSFHDDGIDITINSYRGTLSKEHLAISGTENIGTSLYLWMLFRGRCKNGKHIKCIQGSSSGLKNLPS